MASIKFKFNTITMSKDIKYHTLAKILDGIITSNIWYSFDLEFLESLCTKLAIVPAELYLLIEKYCQEKNIGFEIEGTDGE